MQVNDLEKPFEDVNPTLKAMCLSEAKRRTTSNTKFQRPTMYPPLLKLTSKSEMVERLYQLESMPVEDLLNQVTKADLPEERQKALEILYSTNFKGSVRAVETFSEDIHHRILYDPSRKVRQTFRENQFRKQYGRTLQFSLYTLKEDLDTARRTISIYPDLELHSIRMDERDAFSLYLARLFPEEYDNDILQSALSACLLTHDISHNEFAYLAARLPAEKLHLLFDYWRPNKFLGVERLSEPFSTSLMPLAYRKVWQIISDLVEALLNGEASAIVDATFYLCELGIHQAHELVALALTRIQAKKPDHSHYLEFLKMTAEVELLGININLPSTDFVIDMNDYEASHLWGLIANLLCEIDSSTPPQLWGSVQRRLLGYDDYFNHRFMTLTRGFYRWGISALMEVIAEDNQVVIHLLRRLPDLVHDNKKKWFRNEFEKIVYWIIQNRTQFPDSTFVNWLEEPFWPVRLFSAYILIGRKFPFTHTQIIKLFNDGNEHVVQGILSCAVNGPITGLHEILLQMSDSTQGEGRHLPEVEKVIEAILIYNLNSSDYECISIILSLLKEYQLPTLDKALISLSTRTPPNHLSEILDVMGQRLLLRPDNMLFRNRLQELLQGSDEDIISTSMSILLLAGDREIGSILWKHLQRPYYIPKAQISSSRDLDVDLPPYLGDKIDEDVAPDLGTFIDKGISKELIVNCLFGVALLQYKPAVEDIIRLLEHPEPEVQLAACATCAFLSLEKSLFALEYKIEHLQQIFQHPSTTDEYKSELEEKMQLLSSFISCRTILKQEGILKIGGGTIAIPLGSGIIGLLGCQLPFLLNSNETSLPLCSDRVLNLEFLRQMDPSGWRALALCQPQFLRRLIESDLQTSWLNKEDQQILIASFELMLAHLCQLTQVGGNYTNTSTLAAALQNFGVICHHAMDLVQIVEQIALVIKNNANKLIMQMEATVSNFAHSKDSSQFLRNSLNRLDNLTDGPMTWNQLQEFCEIEALYQYSFIKGVETYPLRKDLEESMTIFSLYDIVESRFLLGEIEGTPDIEFWAHFNHFGRFFNSHNLLYEWGLTTIAVLQQISQQSNLGSTYSHEWPKYRSYLIPRLNNNQDVMVNNPTKANPLEKLFIRFEMPSLD